MKDTGKIFHQEAVQRDRQPQAIADRNEGRQYGVNNLDIPIRPSSPEKYTLTDEDREYIESFAIDGEIPFGDYIRAVNKILNK